MADKQKVDFKIGARVGAIMSSDEKEVRFFGYGKFMGEEVPPAEDGIMFCGQPMTEVTPKIVLDSGDVVWGCECWWGPEERIKEDLGKKKVVIVKIGDKRKEIQAASAVRHKHGEPGSKPVPRKPAGSGSATA